jgi:hypothetical protein
MHLRLLTNRLLFHTTSRGVQYSPTSINQPNPVADSNCHPYDKRMARCGMDGICTVCTTRTCLSHLTEVHLESFSENSSGTISAISEVYYRLKSVFNRSTLSVARAVLRHMYGM